MAEELEYGSKSKRIREAIKALKEPHFTVSDIYETVKQYGITRKSIQQQIFYMVKFKHLRRLSRAGGGRPATYTKQHLTENDPKSPVQIPLIPDNIPLEVVGEAILASFKLLRSQVFKANEQMEKLSSERSQMFRTIKDLEKKVEAKNKEIETIREAIQRRTGKTFPMSEVARVIRNGKLIPV